MAQLPNHPIHADLESHVDSFTLHLTRFYPHTMAQVWQAVTQPEPLALWTPFRPSRAMDTAGAVELAMTDGSGSSREQVVEALPQGLMVFTWGGDSVSFALRAAETGTELTLSNSVADRDFASRLAAGWHMCLAALQLVLDGEEPPVFTGEEAHQHGWRDLREQYDALLATPE